MSTTNNEQELAILDSFIFTASQHKMGYAVKGFFLVQDYFMQRFSRAYYCSHIEKAVAFLESLDETKPNVKILLESFNPMKGRYRV